jgi:hypothetical protein
VLDVVVGAAIGVLIGLFAWPRGGLGEALIRSCPAGGLLPCADSLTTAAADVAARFEHAALALLTDDHDLLTATLPDPPVLTWPTDLGADLYHFADLRVWLDGLRLDLTRPAMRDA